MKIYRFLSLSISSFRSQKVSGSEEPEYIISEAALQHSWRSLRSLVAAWAIVVLMIWILAILIGRFTIPARSASVFPHTPVETLSTWDGTHYKAIAQNGYSAEGIERRRFALFPLLPVVARLLGGPKWAALAGILFNHLCLLGSLVLLSSLAPENRSVPLPRQPGFWLLVAPLAFFFSVFYAESLFLFLTLLMVVAYRRNYFGVACIVGILAGLTRPTALCLPALFIVDAVHRFKRGENWLATLMCFAAPLFGVALYMGFVGYLVGDPLAYAHIQADWWGAHWTFPFLPLIRDLHGFLTDLMVGQIRLADRLARLFSSLSILALMIWGWRRCDPSFLAYLIVAMLFIHSQEPHSRRARYELVLFPVFILLSQAMAKRPQMARIIAGILVAMQLALFIRHATWRWVA